MIKPIKLLTAGIVFAVSLGINFSTVLPSGAKEVSPSQITLAGLISEAQADDEGGGGDCHYLNGYVAFTNHAGGAYNCCMIWVNKAPKTSEGHCH